VRSHVSTPVTEQIAGVSVVTCNRWPKDNNPELLPLAKRVDATKSALLFVFIVTAAAEYKAPVREVESE
jgi:hypothetical protein